MNKRQIIASLNKISNQLDSTGLHKEANSLTNVMKRLVVADEFNILDESNETLEPTLTSQIQIQKKKNIWQMFWTEKYIPGHYVKVSKIWENKLQSNNI